MSLFVSKRLVMDSKKRFRKFGENSIIARPYLQLSGCRNIEIGNGTTILNNSRLSVYGNDNNKANITIGNNCYIGFGFSALASSKANITIEDNVLFASNVIVTNENHGMNPESSVPYMDQELTAKDVSIGEGSWIGEKVCILIRCFYWKEMHNRSRISGHKIYTKLFYSSR